MAKLRCLEPEKVKQEVHGPWRSICLTTAVGMTNDTFMQICTKNSLLQVKKQLKSWVNSYTVPHHACTNQVYIMLALLDFVSYCRGTGIRRLCVVRPVR